MERDEWRLMGWIGLGQIMGLALGSVMLGVTMKFMGYPIPAGGIGIRWHAWAIPLREHGLWLFLVTPLWIGMLLIASHFRSSAILQTISILGILVAFLIPGLYLYTLANLYTRPLLIGTRPAANETTTALSQSPR